MHELLLVDTSASGWPSSAAITPSQISPQIVAKKTKGSLQRVTDGFRWHEEHHMRDIDENGAKHDFKPLYMLDFCHFDLLVDFASSHQLLLWRGAGGRGVTHSYELNC